ncbi:hypothetical protein Ocin01_16318 [Orchesella cincta]|uniref:Uncharacterized protein n=1 Tax=Orchesella cincta TaxID=48709 RepID=A0A1D2MBL4_ORCCI|nr:hypothetical protein Ocin01_16318 [Orchesella cincta]
MPQGKMKVKAKLPHGAKVKGKGISKAKDIQKKNRPAQQKRDLLNAAVTKAINDSNESTFKQKATVEGKHFTVIPDDIVKKGKSAKKVGGEKMDKSRLPKMKK